MKEDNDRAKNHSEVAEGYDQLFSEDKGILQAISDPEAYTNRKQSRFLLDLLAVPRDFNKKLLEVACGGGGFLHHAEKRVTCSGIDISPAAIEYARKLVKKAKVEIGTAEDLPYPDGEFDFVTCLGSLEHFLDMDKGLQEMRRVLKEDGKLLIYVPNLYFIGDVILVWLSGREADYVTQPIERADNVRGWRRLIENNGFEVTKVAGYNLRYPLNLRALVKPSRIGLARLAMAVGHFVIPKNLSQNLVYIARKSS